MSFFITCSTCPKHNEKSNKICDDCKINREAMIDFKSYTSFEILEFKRKQILRLLVQAEEQIYLHTMQTGL